MSLVTKLMPNNEKKSLILLLASTLLAGACAPIPIKGLHTNEPMSPVVVYVEPCDYKPAGFMKQYIWDTAVPRPSDRPRKLVELIKICNDIKQNLKSSLGRESINARVIITSDDQAPPLVDRNRDGIGMDSKFQIFVRKPLIQTTSTSFGGAGPVVYSPYMISQIDVFESGTEKRVGVGYVSDNKDGETVAVRIAKTLRERCLSRWTNGCGIDGSVQLRGS